MDFIWHGRRYSLTSLTPALDQAFLDLYPAYESGAPFNLQSLHDAVNGWLSAGATTPTQHDQYFANFTVLWMRFLSAGNFAQADAVWNIALEPVLTWEAAHAGSHVHKGTPFYFRGMTAILAGDIDRGYALMHDALEEDISTTGQAFPQTPAFFFVTMDSRVDQAFRDWVTQQVGLIDKELAAYRASFAKTLTLSEVQSRFLASPPTTDSIFLFAYVVARLLKLGEIARTAKHSAFVSQLEANIFFDLTLVIDDAIKAKNSSLHYFIDQAAHLSSRAGGVLTVDRLREINQAFRHDFDRTMRELLDGAFRLADGTAVAGADRDIAVAYGLRNRGAHDISASRLIAQRYDAVKSRLFNTLLLCIDLLY